MTNLPSKSRSKNIQVVHTRRLMTKTGPKKVLVNKNNKKKEVTKPANRSRKTPQVGSALPVRSRVVAGLPNKLNENLSRKVKLRWQGVLNTQKGPTELDKKRKFLDKYSEAINTMLPGEMFVKTSGLMGPFRGLQDKEGKVTVADHEGKIHKLKVRWGQNNSWRINVLNQLYVTKEPLIITVKDGYIEDLRPPKALIPADSIPYREPPYKVIPAPTKNKPGRHDISYGYGLSITAQKYVDTLRDFEQKREVMRTKGLDFFGAPLSSQTRVTDYKKGKKEDNRQMSILKDIKSIGEQKLERERKLKISDKSLSNKELAELNAYGSPLKIIKKFWSKNPGLREIVIHKVDAKKPIYNVRATNSLDLWDENTEKSFLKLKDAEEYADRIGGIR